MNYHILNLRHSISALSIIAIATLTSCMGPHKVNRDATKPLKAVFINPHETGSYEHFKANPSYPKTSKVYKSSDLLDKTTPSNSKVIVNLKLQRAFLYNGNEIAMDYPVSTGKTEYPTPSGKFRITEKIEDKRSNLYGKIVDADGKVVKSNADAREDEIPEGGEFIGAAMPHWMRLTGDGIGMHKGYVPRYPASHGCIRTPGAVVPIVFEKVRVGTSVTIIE